MKIWNLVFTTTMAAAFSANAALAFDPEQVQLVVNNQSDCPWCDLSGADFTGVNFRGVDLKGADLTNAKLVGADFSGASLAGAYFTGADLTGANLNGAVIRAPPSIRSTSRASIWRVPIATGQPSFPPSPAGSAKESRS